ncbi:MAG: hypothetical protein GY810_02105 [Aureispira sp.]|nr:hypothetical protein [Aureispira sp.]
MKNKGCLIFTVFILGSIALAVYAHGWLIGSILSISCLALFFSFISSLGKQEEGSFLFKLTNKYWWLVFLIALTPIIVSCYTLWGLQSLAWILIIFSIGIPIRSYLQTLKNISTIKTQLDWIKVENLFFPEQAPKIIQESIAKLVQVSGNLVKVKQYTMKFPIQFFTQDNTPIEVEDFYWQWSAPEENPNKALDYETDLKGKPISIVYNPENPEELATAFEKEKLPFYQKKLKSNTIKLVAPIVFPLVLLGLLLIFISIKFQL